MENRLVFDFQAEDYDSYQKFIKKAGLSLDAPVIHIAGSNGKSSTANMIAAIYEKAGYQVGLFLNTYFVNPSEMIQINHVPMEMAEFQQIEAGFAKLFEKYDISNFQKAFAIALSYFAKKKLDLVVIETGLGGAFDATNLPYPNKLLSIITNISLEHTELLGTTLSQIAYEKSGIFQDGTPVLLGSVGDNCKETLVENALSSHCQIHEIGRPYNVFFDGQSFVFDYGTMLQIKMKSNAAYDVANACLAIEATICLAHQLNAGESIIREALASLDHLPGHFQLVDGILFDGAENPFAMEGLARSIGAINPNGTVHVIFASLKGQNIAVELPLIDNYVDTITITTFDDERARVEDDYFLFAPDYESAPTFFDAVKNLQTRFPGELIVVTGCMEFVYACLKEWREA